MAPASAFVPAGGRGRRALSQRRLRDRHHRHASKDEPPGPNQRPARTEPKQPPPVVAPVRPPKKSEPSRLPPAAPSLAGSSHLAWPAGRCPWRSALRRHVVGWVADPPRPHALITAACRPGPANDFGLVSRGSTRVPRCVHAGLSPSRLTLELRRAARRAVLGRGADDARRRNACTRIAHVAARARWRAAARFVPGFGRWTRFHRSACTHLGQRRKHGARSDSLRRVRCVTRGARALLTLLVRASRLGRRFRHYAGTADAAAIVRAFEVGAAAAAGEGGNG